jgi:hypothetical protein
LEKNIFYEQPIPAYSDLLGPIPAPLPPSLFDVPCSAFNVQIPYYPSYPCASVSSVSSCSAQNNPNQLSHAKKPAKSRPKPTEADQKMNQPFLSAPWNLDVPLSPTFLLPNRAEFYILRT